MLHLPKTVCSESEGYYVNALMGRGGGGMKVNVSSARRTLSNDRGCKVEPKEGQTEFPKSLWFDLICEGVGDETVWKGNNVSSRRMTLWNDQGCKVETKGVQNEGPNSLGGGGQCERVMCQVWEGPVKWPGMQGQASAQSRGTKRGSLKAQSHFGVSSQANMASIQTWPGKAYWLYSRNGRLL